MRALALLALVGAATAQFGSFFDQMFGGHSDGQGGRQQRQKNVASDASAYQHGWESCKCPPCLPPLPPITPLSTELTGAAHCDKYLCPDTLGTLPFRTRIPATRYETGNNG